MDILMLNNMNEMLQISREFPPSMTPLKRASQMQGMKNNKEI